MDRDEARERGWDRTELRMEDERQVTSLVTCYVEYLLWLCEESLLLKPAQLTNYRGGVRAARTCQI